MTKKKTKKITKPKIEIVEETIDPTEKSETENSEEFTYYANIFETTEIVRNIVTQYYNGKDVKFDIYNLEEEYKKIGIYDIYDYARYLIQNSKGDINLLLELDDGRKINLKNIKFPRL